MSLELLSAEELYAHKPGLPIVEIQRGEFDLEGLAKLMQNFALNDKITFVCQDVREKVFPVNVVRRVREILGNEIKGEWFSYSLGDANYVHSKYIVRGGGNTIYLAHFKGGNFLSTLN
jgi:hypothetical protein